MAYGRWLIRLWIAPLLVVGFVWDVSNAGEPHRIARAPSYTEYRDLADRLDSLEASSRQDTWINFAIPALTALIGFASAYTIYARQRRDVGNKARDATALLQGVLQREVAESIERCLYLTECQAYPMMSRTSLPQAARQYLMDRLAEVSTDEHVLGGLTDVYNILDRVTVFQDSAVRLEADGDFQKALENQGRGVAFVRSYLSELMQSVSDLGPDALTVDKRKQILARGRFVADVPQREYFAIARVWNAMVNAGSTAISEMHVREIYDYVYSELHKKADVNEVEPTWNAFVKDYLSTGDGRMLTFRDEVLTQIAMTSWPQNVAFTNSSKIVDHV